MEEEQIFKYRLWKVGKFLVANPMGLIGHAPNVTHTLNLFHELKMRGYNYVTSVGGALYFELTDGGKK